jgi:hypothetical protein
MFAKGSRAREHGARDRQRADERQAVYDAVTERDASTCRACGSRLGIERDHIDGKRMGGDPRDIKTTTGNVACLCSACHGKKTSNTLRIEKLTPRGADGTLRFTEGTRIWIG